MYVPLMFRLATPMIFDHICWAHLDAFCGTCFVCKVRCSVLAAWPNPSPPKSGSNALNLICCWMGSWHPQRRNTIQVMPMEHKCFHLLCMSRDQERPRSELNTWNSFHDVIRLRTIRQSARSALLWYQRHHVKPVQSRLKHRCHTSQRKLTDVRILSLVGKSPISPQLSN